MRKYIEEVCLVRDFNYSLLKDLKWDSEIIGYLTAIHEAKGKQELYLKQQPEKLNKLIEVAKIQSMESSNDIEGIRTTNTRLKQLLTEKTTPKNRDEEEIAGYRDVLSVIHENFEYIPMTANYILQLHKILYSHSEKSIGGKFKNVQNYITINENGKERILFTTPAPFETPEAIDQICNEFNIAISKCEVDPLILIPIFIHDFFIVEDLLSDLPSIQAGEEGAEYSGKPSKYLTEFGIRTKNDILTHHVARPHISRDKEIYKRVIDAWNDGHKRLKYVDLPEELKTHKNMTIQMMKIRWRHSTQKCLL